MSEQTCVRCGAPYDEGATVCFTCGASIGELETPTQPVRTPKAPKASAEVALPPEPASGASGGATAQRVAVAPESSPLPRRVVVGSSLPVPPPPPHTRKARPWLWITATLVVIAALIGGGFALRAALAGPPAPVSTVYHDPSGRFSFTAPALWSVTRQADGALVTDSSGANTVTITVTAAAHQTAVHVADTLAAAQKLQDASPAQIGGDAWQQRAGQVTGQDGLTREIVVLVDVRGGRLYVIQLSSPSASYASVNNLAYQPLLASFTFA